VFHNVKIVGNKNTPPPHVVLMGKSTSNTMVLIKLNIISILLGATKQISK